MVKYNDLETDKIKELFTYKDGQLLRKTSGFGKNIGDVVGRVNKQGYILTKINGKLYRVHRLIYQLHRGQIPDRFQIDHINGIRSDNRIENLRAVSVMENQWNRHNAKGYTKRQNGKFQASIYTNGAYKALGTYETKQEARVAYEEAKKEQRNLKAV